MFFQCKFCGNYSDDGDPLNFVCLKCIDRGVFAKIVFMNKSRTPKK